MNKNIRRIVLMGLMVQASAGFFSDLEHDASDVVNTAENVVGKEAKTKLGHKILNGAVDAETDGGNPLTGAINAGESAGRQYVNNNIKQAQNQLDNKINQTANQAQSQLDNQSDDSDND